MEVINRSYTTFNNYPTKVLQFGDGNFLRGFADYLIDLSNMECFNGGVAVVKGRPGAGMEALKKQEGLYTLFTEGILGGKIIKQKQLIQCLQKLVNPYNDWEGFLNIAIEPELALVVSNTTEAGIVFDKEDSDLLAGPYHSFPAKLTALLHRRFVHFSGCKDKGLVILPCELVNNNAAVLKDLVIRYAKLWNLTDVFVSWINEANYFYNTLVDRIVSGYPKEDTDAYNAQLNYTDELITVCEPYLFWAIEDGSKLKEIFPAKILQHHFTLTNDIEQYRIRKVRILNGVHTALAQLGILKGLVTVGQCMEDSFIRSFINQMIENEIMPTIPLPKSELSEFKNNVFDRFANPFLRHELFTIALNSISKFRARILPTIADYYEIHKQVPVSSVYVLACLIRLYKGEWEGKDIKIRDEEAVLNCFESAWRKNIPDEVVDSIVTNLDLIPHTVPVTLFKSHVTMALFSLENSGLISGYDGYNQWAAKNKL